MKQFWSSSMILADSDNIEPLNLTKWDLCNFGVRTALVSTHFETTKVPTKSYRINEGLCWNFWFRSANTDLQYSTPIKFQCTRNYTIVAIQSQYPLKADFHMILSKWNTKHQEESAKM